MTTFQFPLQRVLDWRQTQLRIEEAKLRQHAAAIAQLDITRDLLRSSAATAETGVRSEAAIAGTDLAALGNFREHTREQQRKIAAQRATQARQMAEQQIVVTEARRRARLLEKLRERRRHDWQTSTDRELENLAAEAHLARRSL
jgi:hypothetical protein